MINGRGYDQRVRELMSDGEMYGGMRKVVTAQGRSKMPRVEASALLSEISPINVGTSATRM